MSRRDIERREAMARTERLSTRTREQLARVLAELLAERLAERDKRDGMREVG